MHGAEARAPRCAAGSRAARSRCDIRTAPSTGSATPAVCLDRPTGGLIELELTKLDPANLPGECLRELVDELDAPRVGVRREPLPDERLDLRRKLVRRLAVGSEHDE